MFIKSRCLFVVSDEIKLSPNHGTLIKRSLEKSRTYDLFFRNTKDIEKLNNFLNMLPSGTIFSESVSKKNEELKYYISLPMFSSHFNLPVKEGEFIWLYPYKDFENSSNNYFNLINSYWISRIHSFFHTEDLNYNYNDRDYIVNPSFNKYSKNLTEKEENLDSRKKRELINKNKKIKNTILRQYTNRSDFFNNKESKSIALIDSRKKHFTINNVPRYLSRREDLTIQGSNNTLINLGSSFINENTKISNEQINRGEISIVAGIGYISRKDNNASLKSFSTRNTNKTLNNSSTKITSYNRKNSNMSLKILNDNEEEENFKLPNISISPEHADVITRNTNEGNLDIIKDASTIKISEENKETSYNGKFYNTKNNIDKIISQELSSLNGVQFSLGLEKESLSDRLFAGKKVKYKSKSSSINKPQIGLVSSNIRLYARNSNELVKNESGGSINLIKDSNNKENYSEISMQPDGNVIITGKSIILGDYEKRKNSIENIGIILGASDNLNSVVLGEKLVALLCEMIEINKEALGLISKALEETSNNFNLINSNLNMIKNWANLHNHSHPQGATTGLLPGTSMSRPELSSMEDINSSSNVNGGSEIERLADLIKNIDKILSNFVQTS